MCFMYVCYVCMCVCIGFEKVLLLLPDPKNLWKPCQWRLPAVTKVLLLFVTFYKLLKTKNKKVIVLKDVLLLGTQGETRLKIIYKSVCITTQFCYYVLIETTATKHDGENDMNAIIAKLQSLSANDVFEIIARLMSAEPTAENDIVLEAAMEALESKVEEAEFVRLMEQF